MRFSCFRLFSFLCHINFRGRSCLTAFDILAYCVEFVGGRIAGHDIYRAYLSPLISGHSVFAQQFDANVPDEDGDAGRKDADYWAHVHLDDNPCECAGDAHR